MVDSPAVNAFAIPGGHVYLTQGIMAFLGDEADMAGVLGHETGTSRPGSVRVEIVEVRPVG